MAGTIYVIGYDGKQAVSALVEIFDCIYSRPLLHWRALVRLAILSVIAYLLYLYELGALKNLPSANHVAMATSFLLNLIVDSVALLLIRRWLLLCGQEPVLALAGATLLGGFVVVLGFVLVRCAALASVLGLGTLLESPMQTLDYLLVSRRIFATSPMTIPPMIVLAWLPLLAIAIAALRALRLLTASAGSVPWPLRDGKEHPLQAIGYVAAAIVFSIAALWQYVLKSA